MLMGPTVNSSTPTMAEPVGPAGVGPSAAAHMSSGPLRGPSQRRQQQQQRPGRPNRPGPKRSSSYRASGAAGRGLPIGGTYAHLGVVVQGG